MISTKGRYALRVMIDLASHPDERCSVKEISARQQISPKYLEHILPSLLDSRLIDGKAGRNGGYRLSVDPDEITVLEVLEAAEGSLSPVACLKEGAEVCPRHEDCRTLDLWRDYYQMIRAFFGERYLSEFVILPYGEKMKSRHTRLM